MLCINYEESGAQGRDNEALGVKIFKFASRFIWEWYERSTRIGNILEDRAVAEEHRCEHDQSEENGDEEQGIQVVRLDRQLFRIHVHLSRQFSNSGRSTFKLKLIFRTHSGYEESMD